MKLNDRYIRPFDRTYASVTKDMNKAATQLSPPASDWLLRLVETFQNERLLWNTRQELLSYRLRWLCFRTKLLRLVAGAYLHICYDLPRALADDWPGGGRWLQGPTRIGGQSIYFRLGEIFPENLVRSARDVRTIGLAALILRPVSERALSSAGIWIDALRKGAWLHAEILFNAPDRAHREAKMAQALTAALEDASLIFPWSIMRLLPPDSAVYSPTVVAVAAFLLEVLNNVGSYAVVAIIGILFWSRFIDMRRRLHASIEFIDLWGYLTNDYVSYAVREPEGFGDYRQRRRVELGLTRGAGPSLA